MAAPNSGSLLALFGEEYKKHEAGKEVPFWGNDDYVASMIKNATEYGGGEGDDESFRIPFEVDGSITFGVGSTYKTDTNKQDVEVEEYLKFKYEWYDQDILVYKQEMKLAKDPREIARRRNKNAMGSYRQNYLRGFFRDDGSASTEVAGLQSIWYDTTYGGKTRTSYASRLDCASATTKFAGGNGTKFTDAIPRDGETLYKKLIDAIWACSVNGQTVRDIFMDTLAFAALRQYLGDKFLVVENQAGGKISAELPPKMYLLIEQGTKIHAIDNRLITTGHCFGIATQFNAIFSVEDFPIIPNGPFDEVPYPDKAGGKIIIYQGTGKLVSMWPTANFWFTQFGLG
jgi:hypothetical protein